MAVKNPRSPVRADHRYIQTLMQSILGGKVERVPAEVDMVARVFHKAGGSWERLFKGSPGDIDLLKRVLRQAYASSKLTRKYHWDGKE